VAKFYNTFIWLGADDRGYAQVYMMQGMNPVRVSTASIENIIGSYTSLVLLPQSIGYGYQEAGHTFYNLLLVNGLGTPVQQLTYDLTTGLWHERAYTLLTGPWPMCFVNVPTFGNGPTFVGDAYSGKILVQRLSYPSDNGNTDIVYTRTAPHVCDQDKWTVHKMLTMRADIGTADPKLDYSNDGGLTWGGRNRSMKQATDSGTSGMYRRYWANQLGRSRDRVYKVTITDHTNLIRIANADLVVGGDTEP
jgi:hypothetical protein